MIPIESIFEMEYILVELRRALRKKKTLSPPTGHGRNTGSLLTDFSKKMLISQNRKIAIIV